MVSVVSITKERNLISKIEQGKLHIHTGNNKVTFSLNNVSSRIQRPAIRITINQEGKYLKGHGWRAGKDLLDCKTDRDLKRPAGKFRVTSAVTKESLYPEVL